ncbi:MAG TPA: TonB-dependent receptor [Prolixibacteraceae bacterium]|jgi:iron complex outermembrane receptor protein
MNEKFKNGDTVVQATILRIIQLIVLLLFLVSNSVWAAPVFFQSTKALAKGSGTENMLQQPEKRITGKVTDQTGAPIPGASVVVKGTAKGTTTDNEGNFTLSIPNDAQILTVSFVGMRAQDIGIGNKSRFDVTMIEETIGVDEVVVIGYGTIRKSDATGSLSVIGSNDFNNGPVSSPDQLLSGHIAGIQVTTNNGQPGANTSVRIRGVNSISASSEPLYVIDGMPVDNSRFTTQVGGDAALSNTTLNPLTMISPNDIESMTVLKDASATAIYGSRGANGVIIIKTKGGKEGVTSVSYSGSVGVSMVSKKIDVLSADQYRQYVPGAPTGVSTDWQNEIFRDAMTQDHNVTFSSGNQNTSYRASISASNQDGIVLSTGLERYTARFNVTHKMFDQRLILSMNVNNTKTKFNNFLEQQTEGADGGVINNALKADPTLPVYNPDGTFLDESQSVRNPVALAKQVKDVTKGDRAIINAEATYFFIPKVLSFKTTIAYDVDNALRKAYQPITSKPARSIGGRALIENNKYSNRLTESYLTYNNTFNQKHDLNVIGGYSWQEFDNYTQSIVAAGFVNDNLGPDNIGGGTNQVASNNHEINRLISFYGRVNYTYDNKYLFTATLRDDGSSRFGSNNRWVLFPSAALAWKIKEEGFLKDSEKIDDLKLRVGYGVTGNQEIGNFRYSQTYSINSNAGTYFGGSFYAPYNITGIANPNLQWEETSQFNVGLDFACYKSKLRGSLDFYSKKTTNLLLSIDAIQPAVSSTYLGNIGTMTNKGVELNLDAEIVGQNEFGWSANFNIAYNKNEITELYNNKDINYGIVSGAGASGNTQILRVGESFGSFYGQKFTGIVNGAETFASTTPEILGKALPDVIMGLTNNLRFGNWDLSIIFRSQIGASLYNNTRAEMSQGNRLPGQNTNLEGAEFHKAGGGGIVYPSSRWVEDASFLRLDNMTLGYNLKFLPNVIKSARLYLTGQNLFVITSYSGYDPEVNNVAGSGGVKSLGIDYSSYPHARTLLFGLNVNF